MPGLRWRSWAVWQWLRRRWRRTSSSSPCWSIGPAPTPRTAFRSPTASPITTTSSTNATAASTASRSCSRNATPATPPTAAWNVMSASKVKARPAPPMSSRSRPVLPSRSRKRRRTIRYRSFPWATAARSRATVRCSSGTSRCSAPIGRPPTSSCSTSPRRKAGSTSSRARRSRWSITTRPTARSRSRCCRRWASSMASMSNCCR